MKAYLVFGIAAVVFIAVVFIKGAWDEKKKKKDFIRKLYQEYGSVPQRKYGPEQYASIARFFERHASKEQIDDITWNDLNLDDVFKRINCTYSSAGEEYLYYRLRTPAECPEELEHFDEICNYFGQNPDVRVKVQYALARLGRTGKYSLYDYLDHLDVLGKRSNLKHHIVNVFFIPAVACLFTTPSLGVLFFILLSIYNMITYFKEKNEIDSYITSFAYVMRLLRAADELGMMKIDDCEREISKINFHKQKLGRFRRGSFWLMSSGRMSGSGNLLDIFMDYLRMILHIDLIKFNSMLAQIRLAAGDVSTLAETIGYLECAIAVGSLRESLKRRWCRPEFTQGDTLQAENLYHLLIEDPVRNSISTDKGVLITGSNASGKSTFLKTVALGAILSQTLYTCPADKYHADFYHICSSMALRDDLAGGESYYIVEIKSIKRILDFVKSSDHKVLCFVDEVLRGTNTVERIAASSQILHKLTGENVLCFAATHDIELTSLLENEYNNYHFEEDMEDGDIHFNYLLKSGKATSRNAIRLLQIIGYDQEIIEQAHRQAAGFLETGLWKMEEMRK